MPQNQRDDFAEALDVARNRVSAFFGEIEGSSKVCACSTEECYVSHGGVSARGHACIGKVLLSPRGLDAVVISHELTHIELESRLGFFRCKVLMPSWFNEGLAVLVSEDPLYTEDAWIQATDNGRKAPELKDIGRLLGKGSWLLSYGTARREVGAWYLRVGPAGLKKLITEVKGGSDFDSAFKSTEP
jgi:hypothetical protein